MLESAWLFVGVVAVLSTAGALLTSDDGMAILLGVTGFGTWGMAAYGALDVTVVSNGSRVAETMPEVTILCAGLSLIPLYIALTGPVDIVRRAQNPRAEEI